MPLKRFTLSAESKYVCTGIFWLHDISMFVDILVEYSRGRHDCRTRAFFINFPLANPSLAVTNFNLWNFKIAAAKLLGVFTVALVGL